MATIPNALPGRDAIRASVLAGAEKYLNAIASNPYGIAYAPTSGLFDWGSNNLVLNNLVVIATAYDISGDKSYRDAVLEGVDNTLGRNALNQSYVTGYGENASHNQHSRWYSHQLDGALPNPPVGSLAGGPNSSIQDPVAQALRSGCAPQFCYIDDIESWSTNELTINWNSPLAWISAFVADQGDAAVPPAPTCRVQFLNHGQWPGHFIAQINLTNTGSAAVNGWELSWSFLGNQKITQLWSGDLSSDGARVSVDDLGWNAQIRPGRTVTFGFIAETSGANPAPGLFVLNGEPCG